MVPEPVDTTRVNRHSRCRRCAKGRLRGRRARRVRRPRARRSPSPRRGATGSGGGPASPTRARRHRRRATGSRSAPVRRGDRRSLRRTRWASAGSVRCRACRRRSNGRSAIVVSRSRAGSRSRRAAVQPRTRALDSRRAPVLLSEVLRHVVRVLTGVPHGRAAAERARFAEAHETGVTWLFDGFHALILAEKYSK